MVNSARQRGQCVSLSAAPSSEIMDGVGEALAAMLCAKGCLEVYFLLEKKSESAAAIDLLGS